MSKDDTCLMLRWVLAGRIRSSHWLKRLWSIVIIKSIKSRPNSCRTRICVWAMLLLSCWHVSLRPWPVICKADVSSRNAHCKQLLLLHLAHGSAGTQTL